MVFDGSRRRDGRRDGRKDMRAKLAEEHVKVMGELQGKEIDRSFESASCHDSSPKPSAEGCVPSVMVVDQDAVSTILENGRGRAQFCDMAVLDFASFTTPGGGYLRGSMAQEESLCSESYLYNVLERFGDWYGENRRRHINCNLYKNRGIVVPAVRFTRDKLHAYADVLVVAAPNARRAREEYNVDEEALLEAMRDRIRFALALADERGCEKLVLGAFGCGVFGWDAEQVAELFREELASGKHVAQQVFFAVPKRRMDDNLSKFSHGFAKFPEAPTEAWAPAPAPVVEAPAEDDDEDWRKYL